mmetsp:Transcript_22110/g.36503  ORF Transcript_22110/g.36503 Transcript_22110/m.36503 type:complete len:92 (-) Transcript_22110:491-766(-)
MATTKERGQLIDTPKAGEVPGGPQDRQLFRPVQKSRQPPDALGFERRVVLRDAKFVKEHDQGPSGNAAQALPEAEKENEDQPRQEPGGSKA